MCMDEDKKRFKKALCYARIKIQEINFIKKISTQLLTVLTKRGIVCVETRKGLLRMRSQGFFP